MKTNFKLLILIFALALTSTPKVESKVTLKRVLTGITMICVLKTCTEIKECWKILGNIKAFKIQNGSCENSPVIKKYEDELDESIGKCLLLGSLSSIGAYATYKLNK
jgi:hypothetical protein